MTHDIRIKSSSSGSEYVVRIQKTSGEFKIKCNCRAGIYNQLCKHKLDLLSGDVTSIVDDKDTEHLTKFLNEIGPDVITGLCRKLDLIDKELDLLKKQKKALRKEIGMKLATGF